MKTVYLENGETLKEAVRGTWYILESGTAKINTVTGGEVQSFNHSIIAIGTVTGGKVWSLNDSIIAIGTMTNGTVCSWDDSDIIIGNDKR